jgi:hypothetical protein
MNLKSKFKQTIGLAAGLTFLGTGVGYSQTQGMVKVPEPGGGTYMVPANSVPTLSPSPVTSGGFEGPLSYPVNGSGGTAGAVIKPQVVHKHKKKPVSPTPISPGVVPTKPMPVGSSKPQ